MNTDNNSSRSCLLCAVMLCIAAINIAHAGEVPISMPAQASLVNQQNASGSTYPIIIGPIVQLGGIAGNIRAIRTIDGQAVQRRYTVAGSDKPAALDSQLAERLSLAGFDTIYHCAGQKCGARFKRVSPGYKASAGNFGGSVDHQIYRALRRAASNGDDYVAYQIAPDGNKLALEFDQVHSRPRQVGAISVNAAEMQRQITQTGRVALYGIFFSTDSARIKSGSEGTIAEIAKLLRDKPKLKLLVVGHTDNRGSYGYNLKLSRRRAQSVVDALVSGHGIDRARLKPIGVGYAAPRASNANAAGRARNRRVELVPW